MEFFESILELYTGHESNFNFFTISIDSHRILFIVCVEQIMSWQVGRTGGM